MLNKSLVILATVFMASLASAFVSQSTTLVKTTTTAMNMVPVEKQLGVIPPLGFFDPLDLLTKGPYGSREENFLHYRRVEVKHCRAAMLATLGMLTQENYRFVGQLSPSQNLDFSSIPNGLKALDVVPLEGWAQIIVLIGIHELVIKERPNKAPGDFGTGYFGIALDDQSDRQLRALNVELSNGRLAMLGILGMFASEMIHGVPLWETKIFG